MEIKKIGKENYIDIPEPKEDQQLELIRALAQGNINSFAKLKQAAQEILEGARE